MAPNRKLPFGYGVQMGQIKMVPDEVKTVQWLYTQYASGKSYDALTRELQIRTVPYQEGKSWNKNMVARILADGRYLGTEKFPKILDEALYQAVRQAVPTKAAPAKKSEAAGTIQRIAMCGVCGARICRDSYRHGKERWYCPSCNSITTKATDQRLTQCTAQLLQNLIRDPMCVVLQPESQECRNYETEQLEREFAELVETPGFDENAARQMVLSLAASRFQCLNLNAHETMKIQHLLTRESQDGGLDSELLRKISAAVLVYPDGEVSLKLKNGQIIERREFE